MHKKNWKISFVGATLLSVILIVIFGLRCKHESVMTIIIKESTCVDCGISQVSCLDCDEILFEESIPEHGHHYGNYIKVLAPSPKHNGLEERRCISCSAVELREYLCTHETIEDIVISEPTCANTGMSHEICTICETVFSEHSIDALECSWGEWVEIKVATPISSGTKIRNCVNCGKEETTTYTMNMPHANSIYIPGTGICHKLYVGTMSQDSIDAHDLVYDTDYYWTTGPWVLGHRTGTMSKLPNVKVGQYIYLSINENIKTYVVRYSEFARQNDTWTDIIGQTSGKSVLSNLDDETLHMYTCYGTDKNDRWMVLAELVN